MSNIKKSKSRRNTPWTERADATPLQKFIDECAERDYLHRHPTFDEIDESEIVNSYKIKTCRRCGSFNIAKNGKSSKGIDRYLCKDCGFRFTPITGTIFDSHKIPISEWMGFLLDLFGYGSFSLTSKVNRNSYNTTSYWVDKVFLVLDGIQDDIMLNGKVWIDETFLKVRSNTIRKRDDGKEYRGLSINQMCIGIACDSQKAVFIFEGLGKTSGRKTINAFASHIEPKSTLVHDKEKSHKMLVKKLELESEEYDSSSLKGIEDKDNPLNRVNQLCRLLKNFLRSHSGFLRDDLQPMLNLFSLITNPPDDKYKKLEIFIDRAMNNPKCLRYRDKNLI